MMRLFRKTGRLFFFAAAFVGGCTSSYAMPQYSITDLGSIIYGDAINNAGMVVGAGMESGAQNGYLYDHGTVTNLTFGSVFGNAHDINNSGQIAGIIALPGATETHAYIYSNGVMTDIGTLGGTQSRAVGINDAGQVVGFSDISSLNSPDNAEHAFLYSGGTMIDLGTLGGRNSNAYAINNAGQIVGYSLTAGPNPRGQPFDRHAFIYENGTMRDIGTPGEMSTAWDINDAGQVVGVGGSDSGFARAFLYDSRSGAMADLGALGNAGSIAYGINNAGQVVGLSYGANDFYAHAFLYDSGTMIDLNSFSAVQSAGWLLYTANDINDRGQIVGAGLINGEQHGYLLTPIGRVPEPAITWLMLAGMLSLVGVRVRKLV